MSSDTPRAVAMDVTSTAGATGTNPADQSVGELVRALSTDLSTLVRDEIRRLDHILEDFLQFARPREFVPKPVDVNVVLTKVADLLDGEAERLPGDADEWFDAATEHPGSWWPTWSAWLAQHAGEQVKAATTQGSKAHPVIEPAPGRYVLERDF